MVARVDGCGRVHHVAQVDRHDCTAGTVTNRQVCFTNTCAATGEPASRTAGCLGVIRRGTVFSKVGRRVVASWWIDRVVDATRTR